MKGLALIVLLLVPVVCFGEYQGYLNSDNSFQVVNYGATDVTECKTSIETKKVCGTGYTSWEVASCGVGQGYFVSIRWNKTEKLYEWYLQKIGGDWGYTRHGKIRQQFTYGATGLQLAAYWTETTVMGIETPIAVTDHAGRGWMVGDGPVCFELFPYVECMK